MFDKWRFKRVLRKKLRGCDFERTRNLMAKLLGEMVIPQELASHLDSYMENPCFDTAFNLIWYDLGHSKESLFLKLFVQAQYD
jgi:hypothetical protein